MIPASCQASGPYVYRVAVIVILIILDLIREVESSPSRGDLSLYCWRNLGLVEGDNDSIVHGFLGISDDSLVRSDGVV